MPHRITWSWYTGRWWVGCYIWYSEEGTGRGPSPPRPLLAVPNVTVHPVTASLLITVLLYSGPLLCGFNVPVKGLTIIIIYLERVTPAPYFIVLPRQIYDYNNRFTALFQEQPWWPGARKRSDTLTFTIITITHSTSPFTTAQCIFLVFKLFTVTSRKYRKRYFQNTRTVALESCR